MPGETAKVARPQTRFLIVGFGCFGWSWLFEFWVPDSCVFVVTLRSASHHDFSSNLQLLDNPSGTSPE
jgi:hypothetical protein